MLDHLNRDGDGVLDLHVHVGPEFLNRRYTIESLAEEAQREGFGFVAKNHFQPTTAWAVRLAGRISVPVIGSIVLNRGVGGINPEAVRAALSGFKVDPTRTETEEGRFVVWMPTIHAEGHLAQYGRRDISTEWGCSPEYQAEYPIGEGLTVWERGSSSRLSSETRSVLDYIAAHDLVLATGHLRSNEVEALVDGAVSTGVRRICITHPLFQATAMPLEIQKALTALGGVYVELAYVNLAIDNLPIEHYMEVIRTVGTDHVVLSSDLGQVTQEPVTEGWNRFYRLLGERGLTDEEFARMAIENPRCLVLGE
jgi:hypothetical protein